LRTVEALERFLRRAGIGVDSSHVSRADLKRVRQLREQITLAMDPDESTAGTILAELAEGIDLRPRLIPGHGAGWDTRFGADPEEGLEGLAPSIVMSLMDLLVAGRWDTIGRCAGAPCCCVFVDRTRNRNRRFCCQLCADRVNQAKARQRSGR
jgi:predicted RNA-binding Zn ribbon-like protein